MEWLNYPTFVVGHPKSGTSLLISMLDNHPQLVVLPEESDFFNSVYRPLKWKFIEHYTKDEKTDIVIGQIINITHLSNFKKAKIDDSIGGNFDYSNFNSEKFVTNLRELLLCSNFTFKEIFSSIFCAFYKTSSVYKNRTNLNG